MDMLRTLLEIKKEAAGGDVTVSRDEVKYALEIARGQSGHHPQAIAIVTGERIPTEEDRKRYSTIRVLEALKHTFSPERVSEVQPPVPARRMSIATSPRALGGLRLEVSDLPLRPTTAPPDTPTASGNPFAFYEGAGAAMRSLTDSSNEACS